MQQVSAPVLANRAAPAAGRRHERATIDDPERAHSPAEAAIITGLSDRTLEALRRTGGGPPFFKFRRLVRYRRRDLLAWVEANMKSSTSEGAS
jgi:hypothetical protein